MVSEGSQVLDLEDRDFRVAMIKKFQELMESMSYCYSLWNNNKKNPQTDSYNKWSK